MMTKQKAAARPAIYLIDSEADALTDLAIGAEKRLPQVSALLLDEIARAKISTGAKIPTDVVTMNATVTFRDEASDVTRTVTLVYPRDADIEQARISVITPIGAGLLGMREGQSILWPDREGHERQLTIIKVEQGRIAA